MRYLMPWNHDRDLVRRGEINPFMTLHREMNRLFDEVFRGFDLAPLSDRRFDRSVQVGWSGWGWPHLEMSETDNEVKVTVELPGLNEKDVNIHLADGVLTIKGENKTEMENKDRLFSERYYGQFERRIPVEDIDSEKVSATFNNGLLSVTLPKLATARGTGKHIPINADNQKVEQKKAA
jgi:HSP20 family protein